MQTYVAGTDKTTVTMVRDYIARIDAAMDAGDFMAAERLIDNVAEVRNIPFRIEFTAQFDAHCEV